MLCPHIRTIVNDPLSLSILPLTGDDDDDDDEASIVSTLCIHTQRVRETKNVDGMHMYGSAIRISDII